MLSIYYGDMEEAIYNTSVYFDNSYLDSWLDDEFNRRIIKSIDKGEVISHNCVVTKILGAIPPTKISNGTKSLILMNMESDKIFNASTCGDNCASWILKIGQKKDLTINLHHSMYFGRGKFTAKVLNNNTIVHNMEELLIQAVNFI